MAEVAATLPGPGRRRDPLGRGRALVRLPAHWRSTAGIIAPRRGEPFGRVAALPTRVEEFLDPAGRVRIILETDRQIPALRPPPEPRRPESSDGRVGRPIDSAPHHLVEGHEAIASGLETRVRNLDRDTFGKRRRAKDEVDIRRAEPGCGRRIACAGLERSRLKRGGAGGLPCPPIPERYGSPNTLIRKEISDVPGCLRTVARPIR